MNSESLKYCVIAGAPRSGTTSLFNYLAAHPDFCSSYVKQTNYFLRNSSSENQNRKASDVFDHADSYNSYFPSRSDGGICLEASPDYIYSRSTAEMINLELGSSVLIVFILRDPVDRFVSLYNHLIHHKKIDGRLTLHEFVKLSLESDDPSSIEHSSLESGNYSKYVDHYVGIFGKERVAVLSFEDLVNSPRPTLGKLVERMGFSSGFFSDYEFKQFNASLSVKNEAVHGIYTWIRKRALASISRNRYVRIAMHYPVHLARRYYLVSNTRNTKNKSPDAEAVKLLKNYYREDATYMRRSYLRMHNWVA